MNVSEWLAWNDGLTPDAMGISGPIALKALSGESR